jgi:hypothetical protein
MNEAAEAYELSSCGTPRGMGYYVEGVQFEGFKNGFLLDGKNWTVTGRMGRAMANNERWVEPAIRRQAERQLAVAARHGVQVEWRVADPKTAEMLRVFFRDARLPIRVEHFAP